MSESIGLIAVAMVYVAWLVVGAVACFGVYWVQRDRRPRDMPRGNDRTVLIVPIRGVSAHFDEFWRAISAQTFQPSRVVFAVESTDDPIYAVLQRLRGGPPVEIVVAGPATTRGQKINNLLSALAALRPGDEVVVFIDADITPRPQWLALLLSWHQSGLLVSAYRWMVPSDDRWSTAFVCVINSSLATTATVPQYVAAWGGSMVIDRATLDQLEIGRIWDRAILDDLTLTKAVRAHGGKVVHPRNALVLSPVSYTWREAIAFGRRQLLLIRLHMPSLWAILAAATTIPVIGWAVALTCAIRGSLVAIGVIIAASVLDQLRAGFRRRVSRKLWGREMAARPAWLDQWATPAWLLVSALVIWSTLFGRRITWAGRTYVLDAKRRVRSVTPSR